MTLAEFIQFCKRYLISILAVGLAVVAVTAFSLRLMPAPSSYTATAISHMEVSTANDYDPANQYNHVTRSQLAYQKIRNYDVIYAADDTIENALELANITGYTPDEIRAAMSLTPDPDKLTETVEVTLGDKDTAIALANAIIDAASAQIAAIEGPDSFMVSNIAPATEETTVLNTTGTRAKLLALGVLAAALAAFGQAAYRRMNDRRVYTAREVQEASSFPILAVIPKGSDAAEHIRHLRSSLLFAGLDSKPVVLAGANHDSGRSSALARSLAASFAAAGRPTLLVEANSAGLAGDSQPAEGLSDAGEDQTDLDRHVLCEERNLSVLPIGTAPGKALDLLCSPAVEGWLRGKAAKSIVIVDAPAGSHPLADAINLTVLHAGTTTKDDIIRLAMSAELAQEAAHALILDGADFTRRGTFRYGNPALVSTPQR